MNTTQLKLKYSKWIALMLMIFVITVNSPVNFGEITPKEIVDVGLLYGKNLEYPIGISSDTAFTFGEYIGDDYHSIVDLSNYNGLIFYKDGFYDASGNLLENSASYYDSGNVKGGYHIGIGQIYTTYEDAVNDYILYKTVDSNVYINCEKGWQLAIGNYKTLLDAQNELSKYQIVFPNMTLNVINPNPNRIVVYGNSMPLFSYDSNESNYVIKANVFEFNKVKYRNAVKFIRKPGSDITVINRLPMSEYLYGVLPKEMSGDWPIEALKAQAVAARNFTYTSLTKHKNQGFDVCATTDCQVYGGYSVEKPRSNQAVDETKGILLYYENELASCYYHSNSGGETDDISNIWSGDLPYIKGIEDPYSIDSPNSNWTLKLSVLEIQEKLRVAGYNVGTLENIQIIERTEHGRVSKIAFIGSQSTAVLLKEKARSVLGYTTLKSMDFSFLKSYSEVFYVNTPNASSLAMNTSRGNIGEATVSVLTVEGLIDVKTTGLFVMTAEGLTQVTNQAIYDGARTTPLVTTQTSESTSTTTDDNNFEKIKVDPENSVDLSDGYVTFYGHGYGHGLGMSQWGAKRMAEIGFDYTRILTYYYSGTYVK